MLSKVTIGFEKYSSEAMEKLGQILIFNTSFDRDINLTDIRQNGQYISKNGNFDLVVNF
jgi:hypothetical protein